MAEPPTELPDILAHLKMSAPHRDKGGLKDTLTLLQYPVFENNSSEENKAIISNWKEWWNKTPWAQDPSKEAPNWGSSCRTSQVWTYFGEAAEIPTGRPYIFCLNCSYILSHPAAGNNGTKHLQRHRRTQSCQLISSPIHNELSNSLRQSIPPPTNINPRAIPAYSTETYEQELVRVVVDNYWSFRTLERPSFQRFLQFLQPNAVIISRYKFQSAFESQFEKASAELLNDLGQGTKISLALDSWASSNHLSFLAIKGYYINTRWQLKEKLLDFIPIRGRHTGASMADQVLKLLSKSELQKKLLSITCDNASNNSTLTQSLQQGLQQLGISWSPSENTTPCLAHIINLVVQDIIQHLRLSASTELDNVPDLQRQQIDEVDANISVPNSLRKGRIFYHSYLSHTNYNID